MTGTGYEDALCLLHREKSPVAEDVNIVGQILRSYCRYHFIDYQVNIPAPVIAVFSGKGMSPQEC